MSKVLAVAEQKAGEVRRVSREVVSAASRVAAALGGSVEALVLGPAGIDASAANLFGFGAASVLAVRDDAFDGSAIHVAAEVARRVNEGDYHTVVFAATPFGKEVSARVAARVDAPLAADATGLELDGDALVVRRPVYAGRAFAQVALASGPRLVSIRPNVFRAEETGGTGEVSTAEAGTLPASRTRVRERKQAAATVDVAEAPIVVSGGRGMRGPEHWNLLDDLREALGPTAALGASRAVVDAGWRPHAEQVGQTGKTVSPKLYIAVAISGAMQHLAGMRGAGTIVAINKDPDAPIFKIADYGIIGDAHQVLPALSEAIRGGRE